MRRFYDILDKSLTTVLQVLVVAMVLSITAEIVLNAIVQPIAGNMLNSYGADQNEVSDVDEKSGVVKMLEGVMSFVAKASSPINTASQTLLVWIGILGSALAFRMRSHLGVDALVRLYPPKVRLILDYISTALVGLFSLAVLAVGGYMVSARAFSFGSKMPGIENVNRGWFYLVLVITGALNLLYCIYHVRYPKPVGESESEIKDRGNS